jgi:hypothetical protein
MKRWIQISLAGLLMGGFAFSQDGGQRAAPFLDDENFAVWRERIQTQDEDLAWEQLPWLTTYHEGLERAAVEGKPLLLWVMNGHPLGCT